LGGIGSIGTGFGWGLPGRRGKILLAATPSASPTGGFT